MRTSEKEKEITKYCLLYLGVAGRLAKYVFDLNFRFSSHSPCYLFGLYKPQISARMWLALPVSPGCREEKVRIPMETPVECQEATEACLTPSINVPEDKEFSFCGRHDWTFQSVRDQLHRLEDLC